MKALMLLKQHSAVFLPWNDTSIIIFTICNGEDNNSATDTVCLADCGHVSCTTVINWFDKFYILMEK